METVSFKIIVPDEKGKVKDDEVKRTLCLLKDDSSDHLSILEDINKLLDYYIKEEEYPGKAFVKPNFLSLTAKLFEDEKEGDGRIVNLLVILINKIYGYISIKETNSYKPKDAVNNLYRIINDNLDYKIKEDAIKIIIIIAKKYPSDVINNNNIQNSYKLILPSNNEYSDEDKRYIIFLFKELIKEGIIKKGEEGSEIIEEILYIAEMTNKKKDIINIEDEELIKEINNYIIIAKEKGFEQKLCKNKNNILMEFIYLEWKKLCGRNCSKGDNEEENVKEKNEEKIKKFSQYVSDQSFGFQTEFLNQLNNILTQKSKYPSEFKSFKLNNNGIFLYFFLPLFFKIYHFEPIFPLFLWNILLVYNNITPCYKHIIKLYNEIIEKMMKESKEDIEMNEERIITIMFLWIVVKKEGRKEEENEYLINSTVKIFEWLGRIEEENEEERKEKNKETVMEEFNNNNKETKVTPNKRGMILCRLLDIVQCFINYSSEEEKEKIKKDGRIINILLEIINNHLNNEKYLIRKGNKNKLLESIFYSYNDVEISYPLSIPSYSLPLSNNNIMIILNNIKEHFINDDNRIIIIKIILKYMLDCIYIYPDIMNIIEEYNGKKEMEREIFIEWNDDNINKLKSKLFLQLEYFESSLSFYLHSNGLSSLNYENNNIIKRITSIYFCHGNDNIYYYEKVKEKEKKNENKKNLKLFRPFIIDKDNRRYIIEYFITSFNNYYYYSIFDAYFLINKSENGCNIIDIFMKELSGEIVDGIRRRENNNINNNNNIRSERRRYERERNDEIYREILKSLREIMRNMFNCRKYIHLGIERSKDSYKGKEKEIKEKKDFISDIFEEEDMKECLILYLKHVKIVFQKLTLSYLSELTCYNLYYNLYT